jgi:hypothetical protein
MTRWSVYRKAVGIGAVALTMVLLSTPAHANMIVNSGFETGAFDDWLPIPPPVDSLFFVNGSPHTGLYAAWFGAIGVGDETLSQAIATVPGDSYLVSFWLAHLSNDHANDFNVWWNGIQVPDVSMDHVGSFDYTEKHFTVVADGVSSTLMFGGREVVDYFQLDDVSVLPTETVSEAQAVPEPLTLLLVGAGVSGLVRSRRLRNRAGAVTA